MYYYTILNEIICIVKYYYELFSVVLLLYVSTKLKLNTVYNINNNEN